MQRQIYQHIKEDLKKKMVLLSGPRQVGKSWLSRQILNDYEGAQYFNYDVLEHRKILQAQSWPKNTSLLVFDELHKMPEWKNWLKGVYDGKRDSCSILVTGSARLETFTQVGDSLVGRYFHHRLLPISPAEAKFARVPASLEHFMTRGGFPEPFLADSTNDAGRWRRQYLDGLIREDILAFENINQLRTMSLLVELLRQRVSSPVSYQSLAEDLSVSPHTVKRYIEILEALYIVFKVHPWHASIARSLVQQPKMYFYDLALAEGGDGPRFENLVALSLYKMLVAREDQDGQRRRLCYLRTKDQYEVDFGLVENEKLTLMVEAKVSDETLSKHLVWFKNQTGSRGIQLVADLNQETESNGLEVRKALPWLENLS